MSRAIARIRALQAQLCAAEAAPVEWTFCEERDGLETRVSDQGLALLRLTNARQRNPLKASVLQGLHDFLSAAATRTDVKVIVIASTGTCFSSGHDFGDFYQKPVGEVERVLKLCSEVNMLLQRVPQPTIACVQGLATAGGCALASSCDLVVASEEARFCLPGTRSRGFCHTPSVALAERVHPRKAFEMALLSEDVSAQEAQQMGLANRVVPHAELEGAVLDIASKLCRWQRGPNHIASGKKTFYEQLRLPSLEDKYKHSSRVMAEMMAGEDQQAGFGRFLRGETKRKRNKNKAASSM